MGQEIEEQDTKADNSNNKGVRPFPLKIKIRNIVIQHSGIFIGYIGMLLMAIYSKHILL